MITISQQVMQFIHRPQPEHFEELACAVFVHQYETVAPYRRYCQNLAVSPDSLRSLNEIPFVSTLAFKYADLTPKTNRPDSRSFLTSGTTSGGERRGRHVVVEPEIYRASALAHLRTMLLPDDPKPMRMLAIHPTADVLPESSLSTMISWALAEFGCEPSIAAVDSGGVDAALAHRFLARAEHDRAAVCILGTTAAFATLFAHLSETGRPLRLAPGSRMMDTGGPKGQVVPLDAATVAELASSELGIPPELVINEYGMTELCSQMYDATPFNSKLSGPPGQRVKIPPPWLRAFAIDPVTMGSVPEGKPGVLGFFDLANVNSVSAIVTDDLGVVEGSRVRMLGRAGGAEARGCALALESFPNR